MVNLCLFLHFLLNYDIQIHLNQFSHYMHQPNFIILMTDQQRSLQHFPEDWVRENLPNYSFFLDNSVKFTNHICNTSPCGPCRASLFSGMYPEKTGITGNFGTVSPEDMHFTKVLADAGYDIYYKGKLHMNEDFTSYSNTWPQDLATAPKMAQGEDEMIEKLYCIKGWTSPDFGTMLVQDNPTASELSNLAGGSGHNDNRVVTGEYRTYQTQESVLEFLERVQNGPPEKPFCLVVSLLNPHDVSLYPNGWQQAGYQGALFEHFEEFELPESYYRDDLSEKPQVQAAYLNSEGGKLMGTSALNYVKFYGYLHTLSDRLHGMVFDALGDELLDNTIVIRTADHGEMGMAHGGMIEKTYNAYEETIKVPMMWYHKDFKPGERSEMISLIDLVPTLGSLAGADLKNYPALQGKDYSALLSPRGKASGFGASLFNYGTLQPSTSTSRKGGGDSASKPFPSSSTEHNPNNVPYFAPSSVVPSDAQPSSYPDNIYAILTDDGWKYAVYYSVSSDGTVDWSTAQYELYNLGRDPNELNNLLPVNGDASKAAKGRQTSLHAQLTALLNDNDITPAGWTPETSTS